MIDPRLKTFITLIEQCNTVTCASTLHITQPAVSQHIHSLEKEYKVKLFIKTGRNLCPTARALDLYHKVKRLSVLEKEIIDSIQKEDKTPITFAVTRSIAESILPKIIKTLMNNFPDYRLSVKVQNTSDILNSLKEGLILFAIIEGNADHNIYTCKPLLSTNFFGVCKNGGIYADADQIDCIRNIPLFLREKGSGSREILESILKAYDLTIDDFMIYHEIENIPAIVKLVESDLGITFIYEDVVKEQIANGLLQPILPEYFKITRQFNFVYMSPTIKNDTLDIIYDAIKAMK